MPNVVHCWYLVGVISPHFVLGVACLRTLASFIEILKEEEEEEGGEKEKSKPEIITLYIVMFPSPLDLDRESVDKINLKHCKIQQALTNTTV